MAVKLVKRKTRSQFPEPADMNPGERESLAHKRIMSLPQDRIDTITSRMVKGDRLTAIMAMIRVEWKELTDVPEATLYKELSRFREARVFGKLLHLKHEGYAKDAESLFGRGINVLDNLNRLVEMQQERVSKVFLRERDLGAGMLMNNVRQEIETLSRLYQQLAELQMDLGMVRRVPREMLVANVEMAASKAGQILEDAIQRDQRIGERLTSAFKLLGNDVFTDLVKDDAGVYHASH